MEEKKNWKGLNRYRFRRGLAAMTFSWLWKFIKLQFIQEDNSSLKAFSTSRLLPMPTASRCTDLLISKNCSANISSTMTSKHKKSSISIGSLTGTKCSSLRDCNSRGVLHSHGRETCRVLMSMNRKRISSSKMRATLLNFWNAFH